MGVPSVIWCVYALEIEPIMLRLYCQARSLTQGFVLQLKKADRQQKSTASRIARRARRDSADAGSGGGGAGAGVGVAAPVAGAVDGDEDAETKEKRLRADALAVARRVADESLGGVTESAQGLPASAVRYLEYADSKGLAGATVSSAAVQSQELAALQKSTLTAELEKRVVATVRRARCAVCFVECSGD